MFFARVLSCFLTLALPLSAAFRLRWKGVFHTRQGIPSDWLDLSPLTGLLFVRDVYFGVGDKASLCDGLRPL